MAYWLLPAKPQLLGNDALLGSLLGIVATLPGFYFAALAAVATFDRPGMDLEIPDPAPTLEIMLQGKIDTVKLTKRMFLSYLFSYLTTISLAVCFLILTLNALRPSFVMWVQETLSWPYIEVIRDIARGAILLSVALPLSALAVATLHGIFFLTERIHQAQ